MWIIPRNHPLYSQFAPDMVASRSELKRQLGRCRRSLMWRSKPSQIRTWLLRWKKTDWFRSLCSRILKHSARTSFETRLISSLPDIPASHSARPVAVEGKETPDISGRGSGMPLPQSNRESVFLRTSKDTSLSGSAKFLPIWLSSDTAWKTAVANQRGEYSQRLNAEPPINGNGSLSLLTPSDQGPGNVWPTVQTDMGKTNRHGEKVRYQLPEAVKKNWVTPRVTTNGGSPSPQCTGKGSRLEDQVSMWQTPEAQNSTGYQNQKNGSRVARLGSQVLSSGQPAQVNHNTHGKNPESWPTPNAHVIEAKKGIKTRGRTPADPQVGLADKVMETWPTPHSSCNTGPGTQGRQGGTNLQTKVAESWPTTSAGSANGGQGLGLTCGSGNREKLKRICPEGKDMMDPGKLNPAWVEQLMGVPTGWTDLGSWEME